MQTTSTLYKQILSQQYSVESKIVIDDTSYDISKLISVDADNSLFSEPRVGNCVSGSCQIRLLDPHRTFSRKATVIPYVRLVAADGSKSEWIQKGKYYVDKTTVDKQGVMTITACDVILQTEQPMHTDPEAPTYYPKTDIAVAQEIASRLGTTVDARTVTLMNKSYQVQFPGMGNNGYSMREVLGYVGAMYAGNWCVNDKGELMLVTLTDGIHTPKILGDEFGNVLIFEQDIEISLEDA